MPWEETTRMKQRARFLLEFSSCLYTMSDLCARYGISRKTGYKWAGRYVEEELSQLGDRSRRPKSCPHRTAGEVESALVELRSQHPSWGPRKLLAWLQKRQPEVPWPAPSTIGDMLKRHGLVTARAASRRAPRGPLSPLLPATVANSLWTSDFKGQFLLGDRRLCYPLTVVDASSRYLLGVVGLDSVKDSGAWPVFDSLFREYGLPEAMRTDNGSPFASTAVARLSRLSVRWLKLGIRLERITPGHPEQNGSHERMHRTLKAETTRPPAAHAAAQQVKFDTFRKIYNEERPHEALGQQPPATRYVASLRPYSGTIPEPEYPGYYEVRSVQKNGHIYWHGQEVMISEALMGERVGLEEVDDGVWAVYFCTTLLARFRETDRKLYG